MLQVVSYLNNETSNYQPGLRYQKTNKRKFKTRHSSEEFRKNIINIKSKPDRVMANLKSSLIQFKRHNEKYRFYLQYLNFLKFEYT